MIVTQIENNIEQAYRKSGNALGWRFLYSPRSVLEKATVAFIGLNPGGSSENPDHGDFDMISGSAYALEDWGKSSKLQVQVLTLFERLNVSPDEVLAGNLVPFRSKSWDELEGKAEALRFGKSLWSQILDHARPRIIVSMGQVTNEAVCQILRVQNSHSMPIGWGHCKGHRGEHGGGIWVGLPHLSRFTIMNRAASQQPLDELFRT